jgi:hypothetical protein
MAHSSEDCRNRYDEELLLIMWQFFAQTDQKADVREKRKAVARAPLEHKAMLKDNQEGRRKERADSSRQKQGRRISFGGRSKERNYNLF